MLHGRRLTSNPFLSSSCRFPTLFKSPFFTVPIPFSPNSLPLIQFLPFHPSVTTSFLLQFSFFLLFQAPYSLISPLSRLVAKPFIFQTLYVSFSSSSCCHSDMGIPRILGIPIPKPLVIWASPVTPNPMPISLGFWEWGCTEHRDAHITVTPPVSTLSFLGVYLSISQLSLFFILLFILLFSRLPPPPPPTPTPQSLSLLLRH